MTGRIVDTETASLSGGIVEIASVAINKHGSMVGLPRVDRVNPECKIGYGAMAIHNITEDMVAKCPTIDKVIKHHKLKKGEEYFIAHNSIFDLKMLGNNYLPEDKKVLCTLKLAQALYRKGNLEGKVENHKLGTLYYTFGLNLLDTYEGDFHGAGKDTYVTGLLLEHMLNEFELTLEHAYLISIGEKKAPVPDVDHSIEPCFMKKYRDTGKTWADVINENPSYVKWLLGNFSWGEGSDSLIAYLEANI
jgi:exodeoxyribonuclease X